MLGISYYQILLKAIYLIGKMKKYHIPICRAYNIIQIETKGIISKNTMLQLAFKALNNTARLIGFIQTLFVFGAYFLIVTDLPLLSSQH